MTEDEIAVKFNALGGDVIGKDQCKKLQSFIMSMETAKDFSGLFELTTGSVGLTTDQFVQARDIELEVEAFDPASRHSTSQASSSDLCWRTLVPERGRGLVIVIDDQSAGMCHYRGRMAGHFSESIQTLPPFTGSMAADEFLTNFGIRGARGFHFVPPAPATSLAKRSAIMAGASVLR